MMLRGKMYSNCMFFLLLKRPTVRDDVRLFYWFVLCEIKSMFSVIFVVVVVVVFRVFF